MLPETVSFTNLEINPSDLYVFRVHSGPYPETWTRVIFKLAVGNSFISVRRKITEWLISNIPGRFGLLLYGDQVVIYFERDHDALLFKMKDGENFHEQIED